MNGSSRVWTACALAMMVSDCTATVGETSSDAARQDGLAMDLAVTEEAAIDASALDVTADLAAPEVRCDEWPSDAASEATADATRDAAPFDAGCVATPADVTISPIRLADGGTCPVGSVMCIADRSPCGENALTTASRCGGCYQHCFEDPFSAAQCRGGRCERRCRDDRADCDCDPTTACDTNIWTDARNCGACRHACAAGETCVTGRCVTPPGARPKAPISALRLRTARPWFRWELAPCADGVRLEVCTTRSCETIEHRWEVTGTSFRPPMALSNGVHFWRLTARRGSALDTSPAAPWEFAVGPVPTGAASPEALLDVNGDGVEDDAARVFHGNRRWEEYMGGIGRPAGRIYSSAGPLPLGDVNGDGFGDVGFAEFEFDTGLNNYSQGATLFIYLGGPESPYAVPVALDLGSAATSGVMPGVSMFEVVPSGDRNGDGFGDLYGWVDLGIGRYPTQQRFDFFGGPSATRVEPTGYVADYLSGRGDFNADGFEDQLFDSYDSPSSPWYQSVRYGAPGTTLPADVRLRECTATESSVTPWTVTSRVLDYNDDGYDDALSSAPPSAPGVVYLGGPMGLDGARCVSIPGP